MKQFTLSDATEVLESGKHHVLHQVAHVALAERNGGAVTRRGSWRKPLGIWSAFLWARLRKIRWLYAGIVARTTKR